MITYQPILQKLNAKLFDEHQLSVEVLRLDLLDPEISGNKWFKLKHNLQTAKDNNFKTILTFGGAFSNHIAATATACQLSGLKAIAVIRGEERDVLNPTLLKAKQNGMHLHFVDRENYSKKDSPEFKNHLHGLFGEFYLIPEGGNNRYGVIGCSEILSPDWQHDYIFCAVGTGTTFAGILLSAQPTQKVMGISVLKGENQLPAQVQKQLDSVAKNNHLIIGGNEQIQANVITKSCITNLFAFKGYARYDPFLVAFKNEFEAQHQIPLDHVYTNKLFYGVFELIKQSKIKAGSKCLIIHSGGLQGNTGFEARFLN